MATGRAESGRANGTLFFFEYDYVGMDIGGNYSTINWRWGINMSGSVWRTNAIRSKRGYINGGQVFGEAVWSDYSGSGDRTLLAGTTNIGHNGDGTKSFNMNSTGWLYANGEISNSKDFTLPTIPRHSYLTALSMDQGGIPFTDEGPAWVEFNNPANTPTRVFLDDQIGRAMTTAPGQGSRFNIVWSQALAERFQKASINSNSYLVNIGIIDHLGGGDFYDYRQRTGYIKNDQGQANPIFTNFNFADTNAATIAITGNNQFLIQGQSNLQVTIGTNNKATPRKFAVMKHYTVNVGGYSNNAPFSDTASVVKDVGVVADISGSRNITVTAVDSRGNSMAASRPVTIVPYANPIVSAEAGRGNGYDDAILLKINGTISPIAVQLSPKNGLKSVGTGTVNRVEYRIKRGSEEYGAWTDTAASFNSATGAVAATNQSIVVAAQGLDSATYDYEVQVRIGDKLTSSIQTISIPVGKAIFRIGLDGNVYNLEKRILTEGDGVEWVTPTLGAGWGNYDNGPIPTTATGDSWRYPRYHKDANGYVHLDGLARNTSGGTITPAMGSYIFTLPEGFRPSHTLLMSTQGDSTACRVDITVDGRVRVSATIRSNEWVSLSPIIFLAEQ
jgi:hypothetical protein